MMASCPSPISDATLIDYWTRDVVDDGETDRVEAHLFACGDCSARLQSLAALGTGLARLVRLGRVGGIVSRSLLNRMQRDGVHVRMYAAMPDETVPCAVFPGDDLVVVAMAADFSGAEDVTLSVTAPGSSPMSEIENVPVSRVARELLWAIPASAVRQLPSMRVQLTIRSGGATGDVVGTYALEHSATEP
jgi:hypothetical protein